MWQLAHRKKHCVSIVGITGCVSIAETQPSRTEKCVKLAQPKIEKLLNGAQKEKPLAESVQNTVVPTSQHLVINTVIPAINTIQPTQLLAEMRELLQGCVLIAGCSLGGTVKLGVKRAIKQCSIAAVRYINSVPLAAVVGVVVSIL